MKKGHKREPGILLCLLVSPWSTLVGSRWAGRVTRREAAQKSLPEASLGTGKQCCLFLSVSMLSWKPVLLVTVRDYELKSPLVGPARPAPGLPASEQWNCAVQITQALEGTQTPGERRYFFLRGRKGLSSQVLTAWGFAQAFSVTSRQSFTWMAESCSSFQIRGMFLPGHKDMIEKGEHWEILGVFVRVIFSWSWNRRGALDTVQCMELCLVLGVAHGEWTCRAGMHTREASADGPGHIKKKKPAAEKLGNKICWGLF